MSQFRFLLLACSSLLFIKPVLAGSSLDALFDKETGRSAATPKASQPARTTTNQKAHGLDGLLEQEQADEARQRQLAEERRKAEEERQRRLSEEKRRRDEAQRLAEQRQREIDDERERESREAQSTKDAGLLGLAFGMATGNRNLATAGLQQTIDGKKTDFTGAYKQDLAEQKQRDDAEARRREAEAARIERQHRQEEQAADMRLKEQNRQIEAYNRQQQQQPRQNQSQQTQTPSNSNLQSHKLADSEGYWRERRQEENTYTQPTSSCNPSARAGEVGWCEAAHAQH